MADVAEFIYEAASHLVRSREALRRQDTGALRVAVLALRDASQAAGAERMLALCGKLRDDLVNMAGLEGHVGALPSPIESVLDAIADELDQVTSGVQTARNH